MSEIIEIPSFLITAVDDGKRYAGSVAKTAARFSEERAIEIAKRCLFDRLPHLHDRLIAVDWVYKTDMNGHFEY